MSKKLMLFAMLLLLLPTLACNMFGGDEAEAPAEPPAAEAPAESAEADAPAEAAETESDVAPESETDSDAAAESEAEVEPTEESEEATGSSDADAAAVGESQAFAGIADLDSLSAYRANFVMEFEGGSDEAATGRIDMTMSATADPSARHLSLQVEGSTVEEMGGANQVEFYQVGDTIYLYNDAMGDGQWISMADTGEEAFMQGFFAPQEDLNIPETANCSSATEMVNGVSAYRCTFSADDIPPGEGAFEAVDGEAWVAEEGNYIVRFILEASGYQTDGPGGAMMEFDRASYQYNLTDLNGDFTIEVPEEALNAQGMDFGGLGGGNGAGPGAGGGNGPGDGQMPVLADAEETVSMAGVTTFYTQSSVEDVIAFYREELPARGWSEDEQSSYSDESTGLLSFEQEGRSLMVTISQEGERVNVGLIRTDQ